MPVDNRFDRRATRRPMDYQNRAMPGTNMPQQMGPRLPPSGVMTDIKALDSSVKLLSQKIMFLVKNQSILSRNLIIINKKISNLQKAGAEKGAEAQIPKDISNDLNQINLRIDMIEQKINELKLEIENTQGRYAKMSDLNELKYVIDAINPIELVTHSQLKEELENRGIEKGISKSKTETEKYFQEDKKASDKEKPDDTKSKKKKDEDIWSKFGV